MTLITNTQNIGSRVYTTASEITTELATIETNNYLCQLDYLTAIKIIGNNAATFLQGQLTCDITKVTADTQQSGALCTLKGRVLALLNIIYHDNAYFIIIPKDLLQIVIEALRMPAAFSKVILTPMPTIFIFGFFGENNFSNTLVFDYKSHIDNNRAILLTTNPEVLQHNQSTQIQYKNSLLWHYLNLQNNTLNIYPETSGMFLPHRLNLHLNNYISFNKGCYKGQEIIARTQYLGTLKHELIFRKIQQPTPPILGSILHDLISKQELGTVIDYCPYNHNHYLIALSTFSHLNSHLG